MRPRSEGGYDKARNYKLAHRTCNSARGALPPPEVARIASEMVGHAAEELRLALRAASTAYYASEAHGILAARRLPEKRTPLPEKQTRPRKVRNA